MLPPVLHALLAYSVALLRTRCAMQLEILALRHQLAVYQRSVRQIDGGEVSCAPPETAVADVEGVPEESRAGLGVPRFLCGTDTHTQGVVRAGDPGA